MFGSSSASSASTKPLFGVPSTCPSVDECTPWRLPVTQGYVVDVYDGDTFTLAFVFDGRTYSHKVRVAGIDCPEMRSKIPSEQRAARLAQNHVHELLIGQVVHLSPDPPTTDKYGRLLAHVFIPHLNADLGNHLLGLHYAVAYDGKTKRSPEDWEAYIRLAKTL